MADDDHEFCPHCINSAARLPVVPLASNTMSQINSLCLVMLILTLHITYALAATQQLKHWYAVIGCTLRTIIRDDCTKEYTHCLTGVWNNSMTNTYDGGGPTNQLAEPVVDCILISIPEMIKSAMAYAQVGYRSTTFSSSSPMAKYKGNIGILRCWKAPAPSSLPSRLVSWCISHVLFRY